jgi:hypothetical protein
MNIPYKQKCFPLDFLPAIQVLVEKMAFIQQALEKVVNNQVGLIVQLPKMPVNQPSSAFKLLKWASILIFSLFFKWHLKRWQIIKFRLVEPSRFRLCFIVLK